MHHNLDEVICLLASITDRPPDPEGLNQEDSEASDLDSKSESDLYDESSDDDIEETTVLDTNSKGDQYLTELKNQFLDRLAEILARFKTVPKAKNSKDAKHVAAAMMACHEAKESVRIFCAKNEGLDHEDRKFLSEWKQHMENIAKKGHASDQDTSSMFSIIADHQRPRIEFYFKSLKEALQSSVQQKISQYGPNLPLKAENIQAITALDSRDWEDHNGLFFSIPLSLPSRVNIEDKLNNTKSDTAHTGETLRGIQVRISKLFEDLRWQCESNFTPNEELTLKRDIMIRTFDLWREPRSRFMLKAAMKRYFLRQKDRNSLLFLARISYAAHIFVQIAESYRPFRSTEIVPISPQTQNGSHKGKIRQSKKQSSAVKEDSRSPIIVARALGIHLHPDWEGYFEQNASRFYEIWDNKRKQDYHHAEIQLITYFEHIMPAEDRELSQKYIGCSRRCCLLCYQLVCIHGYFSVRGTHETLLYRWNVPNSSLVYEDGSSKQLDHALDFLFLKLKAHLQQLLTKPKKNLRDFHRDLRAQSSHGLSTMGATGERKPEYQNSAERAFQRMAMMPTVFGDGLLITPLHDRPGYASIIGARTGLKEMEVTLTEVECLKDKDIRSMFELEHSEAMPPIRALHVYKCKFCRRPCDLRCSACRMNYCSKICQSKDWIEHVFVCCVKNRPNDVDYLKLLSRRWTISIRDKSSRTEFLTALFRDDHFCKTFGFDQCSQEIEVVHLFCIYANLTRTFQNNYLQHFTEQMNLGHFIEDWVTIQILQSQNHECGCFQWFLNERRSGIMNIPGSGGMFFHQVSAILELQKIFSVNEDTDLSASEYFVVCLYRVLLRDFNDIPDTGEAEWIRFGFCYCTTRSQRELLAHHYIQLASHASLNQIAEAWKSDELLELMATKDIDTSSLLSHGIYPRRPSPETIGIYRLMSEVTHILNGCAICPCNSFSCQFHSKEEPSLCLESEIDYGFHETNTWERWQLLNFYSSLFKNPKFHPRELQKARRDPDTKVFEAYIESLVPGFRRALINEHLTDAMFPKFARMEFKGEHPFCNCAIHSMVVSEGTNLGPIGYFRQMRDERNREQT